MFYFLLDVPVQGALDTTNLLMSEKSKEDNTEELLRIHYKYGNTQSNRLQAMATNGLLLKSLVDFTFPVCAACLYGSQSKAIVRLKHKYP